MVQSQRMWSAHETFPVESEWLDLWWVRPPLVTRLVPRIGMTNCGFDSHLAALGYHISPILHRITFLKIWFHGHKRYVCSNAPIIAAHRVRIPAVEFGT